MRRKTRCWEPRAGRNYYAADAVASYAITRDLSLRAELLLSKNESNLELYTYRRDMLTFKLRHDFR